MKSVIEVYSDIAKRNPVWSPDEEKEAIKKFYNAKNKDKFVNEAMKHNLGLVFSLMNKCSFNSMDEDVFQKAVLAMVDALRKFKPSEGVRISTWITNPIRWAIQQARGTYSKSGTFADHIAAINHRYNKNLSVVSVDSHVGADEGDGSETIGNLISYKNVDVDYVNNCGLKSEDELVREHDIKVGILLMLAGIYKILNKNEVIVIKGMLDGRTLADISVDLNLSRVRTSQLSKSAFIKIRNSKYSDMLKNLVK